jgi:diketogulonate reductase-like aldo/keto reductase
VCSCPYDPRDPLPDQVRRSFETSLRNLGTEYLDSLVLHSPMRSFEDTMTVWRVFEELHKTGKVLSLGISNTYDLSVLQRLYREAEVKPSFLQNRFYEDSGYDLDIRSFCRGHNITYQSFWTLTANPRMLKSAPIMDLAHRYQKTPAQMFFKFVQSIGIVPLTGTTYVKHMREDLDVANIPDLSTEEIVSIERVLYNVRTR